MRERADVGDMAEACLVEVLGRTMGATRWTGTNGEGGWAPAIRDHMAPRLGELPECPKAQSRRAEVITASSRVRLSCLSPFTVLTQSRYI